MPSITPLVVRQAHLEPLRRQPNHRGCVLPRTRPRLLVTQQPCKETEASCRICCFAPGRFQSNDPMDLLVPCLRISQIHGFAMSFRNRNGS